MNGLARPNGSKTSATLPTMSPFLKISLLRVLGALHKRPRVLVDGKAFWLRSILKVSVPEQWPEVPRVNHLTSVTSFHPCSVIVLIWIQRIIHVHRFSHGFGCKWKRLLMDPGIVLRHELGAKWSRCVSEHDTLKFVYIRITISFQIPPKKSDEFCPSRSCLVTLDNPFSKVWQSGNDPHHEQVKGQSCPMQSPFL